MNETHFNSDGRRKSAGCLWTAVQREMLILTLNGLDYQCHRLVTCQVFTFRWFVDNFGWDWPGHVPFTWNLLLRTPQVQDFDWKKDTCFAAVMIPKWKEMVSLAPVAVWMWVTNPAVICTPVLSPLCEVTDSWATTARSEKEHWASLAIPIIRQLKCKAGFAMPFECLGTQLSFNLRIFPRFTSLIHTRKRN